MPRWLATDLDDELTQSGDRTLLYAYNALLNSRSFGALVEVFSPQRARRERRHPRASVTDEPLTAETGILRRMADVRRGERTSQAHALALPAETIFYPNLGFGLTFALYISDNDDEALRPIAGG